ncbi:hypothetical protein [Microbacterium sp. 77mftsu3.1]|uniref:hypothetical protein n=1 Tax=Microbacterium sp. 77mftsu3.1 TaxID=1761802 RepID=UPI00036AFA44|nr:hypothetical protein [Microbacterium sp. 77mftsu3.1]SDH54130.1 hypothetical protein SAMN04488590_3522 [Microbacterium sp. 77mftsu3.1]
MNQQYARTAEQLNHVFNLLGAPADIRPTDNGVIVPAHTARGLLSRIAFVQGGSRVPFVNALLRTTGHDLHLAGDEGLHLSRALEDIHRSTRRAAQIDRGVIPGNLSGAEVSRLARRHPGMFAR